MTETEERTPMTVYITLNSGTTQIHASANVKVDVQCGVLELDNAQTFSLSLIKNIEVETH